MMRHAKEERGQALERLATQPVLQRLVQVRSGPRVPSSHAEQHRCGLLCTWTPFGHALHLPAQAC